MTAADRLVDGFEILSKEQDTADLLTKAAVELRRIGSARVLDVAFRVNDEPRPTCKIGVYYVVDRGSADLEADTLGIKVRRVLDPRGDPLRLMKRVRKELRRIAPASVLDIVVTLANDSTLDHYARADIYYMEESEFCEGAELNLPRG